MKTSITLFLLIISSTIFSQTFDIQGEIRSKADNQPLIGAHISMRQLQNTENFTTATDLNGVFKISDLLVGEYMLEVTYIGYENFRKTINIKNENIDIGRIRLVEGIALKEVEITESVIAVEQKGDTMQFNSKAYKTLPDASAEDLIEKMPTVVIDNGTVQAQGEDVKKVLVDGKPFFGNDPTAALRNLPAEVIDKIQIFDQQSDQSEFTGFDDGSSSKTINIITKKNMRNGEFGKLYGGYGYENKYQAGVNLNIFKSDQRISIISQSNNINQQNFAKEDLLGVIGSQGGGKRGGGGGRRGGGRGGRGGGNNSGSSANDFLVPQQGGVATTHAFGVNYSDQLGEKMEVSGSYFFNWSDNLSDQFLIQNFVGNEEFQESYSEENRTENTNQNHRLNARLTYNINDANSLILRPQLSFQGNDGLSAVFGQNQSGSFLSSQTENLYETNLQAMNFSNNLLWRHKFEKRRRTFSINLSNGFAPKSGENSLFSESQFFGNNASADTLNQISTLDLNNWNIGLNVQFTEPISRNGMLMLNYRASYQQEENEQLVYDFSTESSEYDLFNENLSNVFSNDYQTHQLGGGYNFRKGNLMLMARANVQYAELVNTPNSVNRMDISNTFFNVLPMAMLRIRKSRTDNLRINYRSTTNLPNIEQLQEVIDNSNPLQLSIGNAELLQSLQHTLSARYSKTNIEKSSVFFAYLGGGYTNNYIGSSTYLSDSDATILSDLQIEKGVQLSRPVNLDGYWNAKAFLTYGVPLDLLSSKLNFNFATNYARIPGLINEQTNYSNNSNVRLGFTLGSNISENLDFTLTSRTGYNIAENSLQLNANTNYFDQQSRFKFTWIIGEGLVFRTDLTHQYYNGLSETLDQNYLLWNMSIGKKMFENDRGEISFSVFDLLKQNVNVNRNVTETYIEDVQTNALQQYVMLNFKYDLRNFRME